MVVKTVPIKIILIKILLIISIICIFISVNLFFGCTQEQKTGDGQNKDEIGYNNDFTLLDLDENEVSLSDFKGKIVILNFWATWCPPCRLEIPDFVKVYNYYSDRDVQFIGVSLDTDIEALKQFVSEYNINYPILIDGSVENVSDRWGISGIPTTFILDENGRVLSRNVGLMTEDQLVKAIEDQL